MTNEGKGTIRLYPIEVIHPIECQVDLALMPRTDLQSTPESDLTISAGENEEIWESFVTKELYDTRRVELRHFSVMDYLPISPGTYHTLEAKREREHAEQYKLVDDQLAESDEHKEGRGTVYNVYGKAHMLNGGIGSVRLLPWEIGGEPHFFMSATSNGICHQGFPVLVPRQYYGMLKKRINKEGGAPATLSGEMRYVRDLPMLFGSRRRIRRLFLCVTAQPNVDSHHRIQVQKDGHEVSAAVSFLGTSEGRQDFYSAYVSFNPADDQDRKRSCAWLEQEYIKGRYQGQVFTDFDEDETQFPDAEFGLPLVMSGCLDVERVQAMLRSKGVNVPADGNFVNHYYQIQGDLITIGNIDEKAHVAVGRHAGVVHTAPSPTACTRGR